MNKELINKLKKYFKVTNSVVRVNVNDLVNNKEFTKNDIVEILKSSVSTLYVNITADYKDEVTKYLSDKGIDVNKFIAFDVKKIITDDGNNVLYVSIVNDTSNELNVNSLMTLTENFESTDGLHVDCIDLKVASKVNNSKVTEVNYSSDKLDELITKLLNIID